MSATTTRERPGPSVSDPFGALATVEDTSSANLPALRPAGGAATDRAVAQIITAQRVAVKRDLGRIMQEVKAAGIAMGPKAYYSIPFKEKNRATGEVKTVHVEGISIKGAMAVVSLYGNCDVAAVLQDETATSWVFAARFIDFEKGVTITRLYQQRKSQSSGMKDTARQLDMIFQSGQSKAMRNVIEAALPLFTETAFQAAKDEIRARISRNPDGARDFLLAELETLEVPLQRVERIVGRKSRDWDTPILCRLYIEVGSVRDGMAIPDDFWPAPEGAEDVKPTVDSTAAPAAQEEAKPAAEEKPAEAEAKPKEEAKPEAKAAPAEEPAPEAKPATSKKGDGNAALAFG